MGRKTLPVQEYLTAGPTPSGPLLGRRQLGLAGLAGLGALWSACKGPSAGGRVDDAPDAGEMARDQWFFAAQQPEPVLVALTVQRTRSPREPGAVLEAKAFIVAKSRLQVLFFERVGLKAWPTGDLSAVVAAWQAEREGQGLRVSADAHPGSLALSVAQPSGAFSLQGSVLNDGAFIQDPHGAVHLQAGAATLEVNGKRWQGRLLWEQLQPGARAWVNYGQFEMWVLGMADGSLGLARLHYRGDRGSGELILQGGGTRRVHLASTVTSRTGPELGPFPLARGWHLSLDGDVRPGSGLDLSHVDGTPSRGTAPGGGPAVYDIGVATGPQATALVFGLRDKN